MGPSLLEPLNRSVTPLRTILIGGVIAILLLASGVAVVRHGPDHPLVIVGAVDEAMDTPLPGPTVIVPEADVAGPAATVGEQPLGPVPDGGLKAPNGRPTPPAIEFRSGISVPDHLVFVLVLGSDARPHEDLLATRADALHLVALNPRTRQGTILGFPRDSYVQFPRGGRGKINDALSRGGPGYVVETVRLLTGLPVDYYVLTGFVGLERMVDDLGGVDIHVDRRTDDKVSGARFQAGWHRMTGAEALAFSRNRNDVPNGDFSRSEHQGQLMLAGLGKLRSEVADDPGLFRWLDVLRRTCRLDVPAADLPRLAALARRTEPGRLANLVVPGRIGMAGRASVVYLSDDAPRIFMDLRDDAVVGRPAGPTSPSDDGPTTTTTAPTTTTTTIVPSTTTTTTAPIEDLL